MISEKKRILFKDMTTETRDEYIIIYKIQTLQDDITVKVVIEYI